MLFNSLLNEMEPLVELTLHPHSVFPQSVRLIKSVKVLNNKQIFKKNMLPWVTLKDTQKEMTCETDAWSVVSSPTSLLRPAVLWFADFLDMKRRQTIYIVEYIFQRINDVYRQLRFGKMRPQKHCSTTIGLCFVRSPSALVTIWLQSSLKQV